MVDQDISQELTSRNVDEIRNYFLEDLQQNELISGKHKKVCATLNYIGQFLILASTTTGCILISYFVS